MPAKMYIVPDEDYRVTGQQQSQYSYQIQKLTSQVKEHAKQKAEQSIFISNLNREVDLLKKEKKTIPDGVDGEESGTEQRLRDHIKEQSKTIVELKAVS